MRVTVVAAAIALTGVGLSVASDADAAMKRLTNIPPQALEPALEALAKQRELQILYRSDLVGTARTHGAAGDLTLEEALERLLEGTGLGYKFLDDAAITIIRLPSREAAGSGAGLVPGEDTAPANAALAAEADTAPPRGSFWQRFRLAQADEAGNAGGAQSGSLPPVDEITVTAQKRGSERLLDVPIPVSALRPEDLVNHNLLSLKEYYTQIPGLNMRQAGNISGQVLSIRGISTGSGNPTVGIMIDDVPYGGSTLNGGGLQVPDLDPGDLERIEVLRGPQGTLYGASSMGGLIKFVSVDPSTERLSGRIQGGGSGIYNGDEAGFNLRGSINVPVNDTLALRASGFTRHDPGYVDNVLLDERAVNSADVYGGRLLTHWRPSEDFSLKLNALIQDSEGDGLPYSGPYPGTTLGYLQQSVIRGVGDYYRKARAYSATLTGRLGDAELTALSGYSINSYSSAYDASVFSGPAAQSFFGVSGAQQHQYLRTRKFSQEVRVSVPVGTRMDALVGGFFTDESTLLGFRVLASEPLTGLVAGELVHTDIPTTFKEYAAFANLTFHLTDRFEVQIGGRHSQNKQTLAQSSEGAQAGLNIAETRSKEDTFTYLLTPRFTVSPDLMLYARIASGYRAGGPNTFAGGTVIPPGVPVAYEPDQTENYELGAKGHLFNRALSFDLSLYHIDWTDLQILVFTAATGNYTINGAEATSDGVELSLEAHPLNGMTIAAWATWNDAALSSDLPLAATVRGFRDTRLPFSSRFSGSVSIDHEFSLTGSMTGMVGASVGYVGDRLGPLQGPGMSQPGADRPRQDFSDYTKLDLRAGIRQGEWTTNLFVTNVNNSRGAVDGGPGGGFPTSLNYIQPRAYGLSIARTF